MVAVRRDSYPRGLRKFAQQRQHVIRDYANDLRTPVIAFQRFGDGASPLQTNGVLEAAGVRTPRKISACRGSANRVSEKDRGSILIIKTQESSANCTNSIFTKIFGVQN